MYFLDSHCQIKYNGLCYEFKTGLYALKINLGTHFKHIQVGLIKATHPSIKVQNMDEVAHYTKMRVRIPI